MQAGIIFGYVGQIDEVVRRIKAEYGKEMKVIATGGLARMIAKESATIGVILSAMTAKLGCMPTSSAICLTSSSRVFRWLFLRTSRIIPEQKNNSEAI